MTGDHYAQQHRQALSEHADQALLRPGPPPPRYSGWCLPVRRTAAPARDRATLPAGVRWPMVPAGPPARGPPRRPPLASPPTASTYRVATASTSHNRSTRSGSVIRVACHSQPPLLSSLKPSRSGSLCGRRCLMLLLTCLFENPMSRRMVAEYARLHLLMPTTAGAGCFPPAIAPRAWQYSLPHALAQLGRCRYLAQQREQRIHLDQLADCHHLAASRRRTASRWKSSSPHMPGTTPGQRTTCSRVVHQQAERHLKQYRLRHRCRSGAATRTRR